MLLLVPPNVEQHHNCTPNAIPIFANLLINHTLPVLDDVEQYLQPTPYLHHNIQHYVNFKPLQTRPSIREPTLPVHHVISPKWWQSVPSPYPRIIHGWCRWHRANSRNKLSLEPTRTVSNIRIVAHGWTRGTNGENTLGYLGRGNAPRGSFHSLVSNGRVQGFLTPPR